MGFIYDVPFSPAKLPLTPLIYLNNCTITNINIENRVFFLFTKNITTNLTFYYTVLVTIQYYRNDTMGSERQ